MSQAPDRLSPVGRLCRYLAWWGAEVSPAATHAALVVEYADGGDPTVYEVAIAHSWRLYPGRLRAADLYGRLRECLLAVHPDTVRASLVLTQSGTICGVMPVAAG